MKRTSSLIERYIDYLDDIAEEIEFRSKLSIRCKNMADSSLKSSIARDGRKLCSDYKKNGHNYLEYIEEIEELEEKIESGIFSEDDRKRLLELHEKVGHPLEDYFCDFSSQANTMARNGYTDREAYSRRIVDNIPSKINAPLQDYINEKKDNFNDSYYEIRKFILNAEAISNNINVTDTLVGAPGGSDANENRQETTLKEYDINDKNFLQQYMKDVYDLEKEKFCSLNVIQKIEDKASNFGISRKIETEYFDFADSLFGALPIAFFVFVFFACVFGFSSGELSEGVIMGGIITVIFIAIIMLIKWLICHNKNKGNIALQKEDNLRLEREQIRIQKYLKAQMPYNEIVVSCNKTLDKLYSMNVIHPKYRNFLAVSQLYEYIETGRAFTLEGHEGAYNLYENELRQNIIIMQLDRIQEQLEEIKRNQQMIYSAICETNNLLANIESNTAATAYNTAVIANNTAIYSRY